MSIVHAAAGPRDHERTREPYRPFTLAHAAPVGSPDMKAIIPRKLKPFSLASLIVRTGKTQL